MFKSCRAAPQFSGGIPWDWRKARSSNCFCTGGPSGIAGAAGACPSRLASGLGAEARGFGVGF